jgi:hypothetical protein
MGLVELAPPIHLRQSHGFRIQNSATEIQNEEGKIVLLLVLVLVLDLPFRCFEDEDENEDDKMQPNVGLAKSP